MGTISVNPPKTPVTKGSSGIASATVPNICKMPGPPAPFVPTPLPNIGQSSDSPKDYSKTVKFDGQPVAIRGATFGSKGDIASKGTGGGLISSNTHGPTKFIGPGSMNVQVEGKNVQLLGDPMLNNCGPSGSPPNSATMTGVLQAPGVIAPIYGDDEPCTKELEDGKICGKKHPIKPDKEVSAVLGELFGKLGEELGAQREKISRMPRVVKDLNAKRIQRNKLRTKKRRGKLEDQDTAELAKLELEVPALEIELNLLKTYFQANALFRENEGAKTYNIGYMVGVLVCKCGAKKLIACSGAAPPGFVKVAQKIAGYQRVGPVVGGITGGSWNCAAKHVVEASSGHKPIQLLERLFQPYGSSSVVIQTLEVDDAGVMVKMENLEFKTGQDVPSCVTCQKNLPAMYCQNDC